MFIRRRMYAELGGYQGYMATPVKELQECYLSHVAELKIQDEQYKEQQRKQAEQEAELERMKRQQQGGRH